MRNLIKKNLICIYTVRISCNNLEMSSLLFHFVKLNSIITNIFLTCTMNKI